MNIATYGSLTIPQVMTALLGKDFASEPIVINGYERFTLAGKRYPGLIESPGKSVDARIYFDLDPTSVEILDKFEDEIYDRVTISVETSSRGSVQARAYVVPLSNKNLLSTTPWIAEDFIKIHLSDYVEMCKRFRAKILPVLAG